MNILSLASFAVLLLQTALSPNSLQKPKAGVEGVVMRQGSNTPVPGARVTLSRRATAANAPATPGLPAPVAGARGNATPPPPPIPSVATDEKGRFTFMVEEGTYALDVQANGYVRQAYGQRFQGGPGSILNLTSGQTTRDVNISLIAAGNISGRVRDLTDQPLADVPVQLLRYTYDASGQRTYATAGVTRTNDRGEYRMYWVTPGRYYLQAGTATTGQNAMLQMMALMMRGAGANGNSIPPVQGYAYYPNATDLINAQVLDLQSGGELQAIDVTLPSKLQTFSLRGKVVDAKTGQAPRRARVMAIPQSSVGGSSRIDIEPDIPGQNYDAATGNFEIRQLAAGAYTVVALVAEPLTGVTNGPTAQSMGMISAGISNADVDGIIVSVTPAAALQGRVTIQGQLPAPATIERIRVTLQPTGPSTTLQQMLRAQAGMGVNTTQLSADGTYRLNNVLPGEYRIDLTVPVPGRPNAGFIKEARFEGMDVLNSPLRFSGSASGVLDLVYTIGGGQLTGSVSDARSLAVPGTRVVIVPDRARHRTELYRVVTTDPAGRFTAAGLAPGDYKVFAWESIEEFAWFDPSVLTRFENLARVAHVTETSNDAVELRLIPAGGGR